jgi:hypothetical protein
MVTRGMLAAKFGSVFPHLDERQRRLYLGSEARALGHGGIRLVAAAAGVREATVSPGVAELESRAEPLGRARRPGGGRKRAADTDSGLVPALLALVQGHRVSADTVHKLLRAEGFSLQGNPETIEGKRHPDRDAQFGYINAQARACAAAGDPVISVDTKKKEQVGEYHRAGRTWRPKGDPVKVRDHDFPGPDQGKAIP